MGFFISTIMLREPEPFRLNMGLFIDWMSSMGFSLEEIRRVTFLTPFEDRALHAICGGIRYRASTDKEYAYNFMIGIGELLESPPDLLYSHYKGSLYCLVKELSKIR